MVIGRTGYYRILALCLIAIIAVLFLGGTPALAAEAPIALTDLDVVQPVALNQAIAVTPTLDYDRIAASNQPGSHERTLYQFDMPDKGTLTIESTCESYYAYYFIYDAQGAGVFSGMSYRNGSNGENKYTKDIALDAGTYLFMPSMGEAGQLTFTLAYSAGNAASTATSASQQTKTSNARGTFGLFLIGMLALTILAIAIAVVAAKLVKKKRIARYQSTSYYAQSGKPYAQVMNDAGARGEFWLGETLESIYPGAKIVFNIYAPKDDGTYSEVDAVMVTAKAVYVFESKNYSGWIFGNERDTQWTQTFKNGTKSRFYNPIKQNGVHIQTLAKALSLEPSLFVPIIVFGDKCVLKKATVESGIPVIYRRDVGRVLSGMEASRPDRLSETEQAGIYSRLRAFANVDDSVKAAHVENAKSAKYHG